MKSVFSINYREERWCAIAESSDTFFFFTGSDPGAQLVSVKRLGNLMSQGRDAVVKGNIRRLFAEEGIPNQAFIDLLLEKTNTLKFAETELYVAEAEEGGKMLPLLDCVEDAGRALVEYVLA